MADSRSNQREKEIFERTLDLESSEERLGFIRGACADDLVLLARVRALLQAHDEASRFLLDAPGADLPRTLVAPITEQPGDRIGRYKLLQIIGEGGCGVVYMAEQEEPVRRRVALKVIKLGMDTKSVIARFEAERQALAMMDHPNIAKVLDGGATDAGRPYFVMELVRGVKITEYCDEAKHSTRDRLDLFIKVCQAIQHAHQKGIIHRDIKPSNILVTINDGIAVPNVIDFGIAKATEARLTDKTFFTQFEAFIGTPAYVSPEQAVMTSQDIDTRSDIYSLGVLLYELLAGNTPFDAKELVASGIEAMRKTIREKEPVRPSTRLATLQREELTATAKRRSAESSKLLHQLKGDLDWIVMKCLEKDRARRYETANGLARDIQRHLNNEPVAARPPSAAYRLQKALHRNKLVFAAGAAVAVALVTGIGVSTWQAAVATLAKNQAIRAELERASEAQIAERERNKALAAKKMAEEERVRADEQRQQAENSDRESRHLLYVANMNLAQQAWEQNNLERVRQLLKDTAIYPARGFEWYYWQRETHLELKTLRGHRAPIRSVAFSPDGQRIITGSEDLTAKVWDAGSGKELFSFNGDSYEVRSVAFSPDGQRIVTGGRDNTKVRDASSGKEVLILKGDSGGIWSVAFSPDGQRIVTGSWDQAAKVWDAISGRELLTLKGHSGPIWSVAFSPDSQRIVTGSNDATAKVWDATSGQTLVTLIGHTDSISSAGFSRDGQWIVTGSGKPVINDIGMDHTAKVWDAASGKVHLTLSGHGGQINSATFSPDGQWIITGSDDQTARVWNAADGKEWFTLKGHSDAINSVAYSRDGQLIVTGSSDGTAKVWDVVTGNGPLTLKGHSDLINSVAFSPDGQRIVTGSRDHTAKVWEAAGGKEVLTLKGHTDWIVPVAFSPDGSLVVTGSGDRTARVWEVDSGKELRSLNGHGEQILGVAFSPDGQRIVTGSEDKTAKVWDAATGKELFTLEGHREKVWSVAISPNDQRIVTGSSDGTAKLWDAATGKELLTLKGHSIGIWSVAFSPDSSCVVTGSGDRTAKIWEVASGEELRTLKGHGDQILSVAFSSDGQRIVTGSWDRTAKVWDAATGQQLLILKGHSAQVRGVAFSPDGQRIATGGWDHIAKIWQTATPQQVAVWQEEEKIKGPLAP